MSLGITLGGIPILLEDPRGKVQEWLDHYLALDDLRIVAGWQFSPWRTWNVPAPNYPDRIRTKLNTFYRPVGATRWSFGLFLASRDTKNAIVNQLTTGNPTLNLRFEYPEGNGRAWAVHVLAPRPISANVSDPNGAWIIPVVDERYYWQFVSAGGTTIDDAATWESLMASLATPLGITLNVDTVPSAYGSPDPTNFNDGSFANAAQLLDACAWSVGQRIVLQYLQGPGGPGNYYARVYQSCNWSTSLSRRNYNFSQSLPGGAMQAGLIAAEPLNLKSLNPAAVQVAFPKWANGIELIGAYLKSCPASDYTTVGSTNGITLTIQSTALANYTTGAADPDNKTALDALAGQIASDFYRQTSWVQDSNYMGVGPWIETGWDDYVEFSMGRRREDGSYECKTRIHSVPYNLGVQSMLHWTTGTHVYPWTIEGKLDATLTPNGTAVMSVWEGKPPADSGRNVTVTDRLNQWIPSGTWVVCDKVNSEWRVRENRRRLIGYTNTAHNKGANGTIKLYTGATAGSETDTGTTFTAWNGFCNLGSGKRVICDPIENGYHIVTGDVS